MKSPDGGEAPVRALDHQGFGLGYRQKLEEGADHQDWFVEIGAERMRRVFREDHRCEGSPDECWTVKIVPTVTAGIQFY